MHSSLTDAMRTPPCYHQQTNERSRDMSHAATFESKALMETAIDCKRHRYEQLVALAKKHAALARDYADQARFQRESIERTESEICGLEKTLSMGK